MGCGNSNDNPFGVMYAVPIENPGVQETPVYRNPQYTQKLIEMY